MVINTKVALVADPKGAHITKLEFRHSDAPHHENESTKNQLLCPQRGRREGSIAKPNVSAWLLSCGIQWGWPYCGTRLIRAKKRYTRNGMNWRGRIPLQVKSNPALAWDILLLRKVGQKFRDFFKCLRVWYGTDAVRRISSAKIFKVWMSNQPVQDYQHWQRSL